jgi:hypothetical protein
MIEEEVGGSFADASAFDEIAWPTPAHVELMDQGGLPRFDPSAFDADAAELTVQSLESESISLGMPASSTADHDPSLVADSQGAIDGLTSSVDDSADQTMTETNDFAGARWALDGSALDSLVESGGNAADAFSTDATSSDEDIVSSVRSPGDDSIVSIDELRSDEDVASVDGLRSDEGSVSVEDARGEDARGEDARGEEDVAAIDACRADLEVPDAMASTFAAETSGIATTDSDPWAGTELPEPAFGSIGWPAAEAGMLTAPAGPIDASVDEMSDALGWSDADPGTLSHAGTDATEAAVEDAIGMRDDALADVAHELRHSVSGWSSASDVVVDEDAEGAARARFYSSAAPTSHPAESSALAAPELGAVTESAASETESDAGDAAGDDAGDDAGAAIADALARVAARIRSGEVELASGAVGASDESALAAALAALLRGPRR